MLGCEKIDVRWPGKPAPIEALNPELKIAMLQQGLDRAENKQGRMEGWMKRMRAENARLKKENAEMTAALNCMMDALNNAAYLRSREAWLERSRHENIRTGRK